jgi:hypothetical protein
MNGKKLALKARFNRGVSAMVLLLRVDVEMAPLALSRHTAVSAVFWETPY